METVSEEWRQVKGYEGLYEVSSCGKVRSKDRTVTAKNGVIKHLRGLTLAIAKAGRGYSFVCLYDSGCSRAHYVHRLVAAAFIGDCPPGIEVNHKDGNKDNNHAANLEYVTSADNTRHAVQTGLINFVGEGNPMASCTEQQIRSGHAMVSAGATYREAAATCGVSQDVLESACRGINWKSLALAPIRKRVKT